MPTPAVENVIEPDSSEGTAPQSCWPITRDTPVEIVVRLDLVGRAVCLTRAIESSRETVFEVEVWRLECESLETASDAHEALSSRQENFADWAVAALAFGPEWVSRATAPLITKYIAERARVARELEKERVRLEEKLAAETRIGAYFRDKKGRFLLELERGCVKAKPIWTIGFDQSWERDRFWDWLRWQKDRFEEFAEFMRDGSSLDLERRLLREMLVTEQAVKKQGLGSGGRQPLRFWRGDL